MNHWKPRCRACLIVATILPFVTAFLSGQSHFKAHTVTVLAAESPSSKRRQPWNFFRFLQQSSRFVSILPTNTPRRNTKVILPGNLLWEPNASSDFALAPLDDVVMGGASSSTFSNGRWTGQVTDANNGGFVGIRSTPYFIYDMSKCTGIELVVKMSGTTKKRFKLGLRDSKEFNGIVWSASFDLKGGSSSTIRVPFSKFVPTLFARTVPNATPFRAENVVGVQLVYSKFEYEGALNPNFQVGEVDLEVVAIKAY